MERGPWNNRTPTLEEERKFQKLISLHALTDAWTVQISSKQEISHLMERMEKISLNQNLWFLEKLRLDDQPLDLHQLVGAQDIATFLSDFSSTLWTIQISHLENALSQTDDREGLINLLQKTSWNYGKKCCEKIWNTTRFSDLSSTYRAFQQSHFYKSNAFLLRHESELELSFLWVRSPFQDSALNSSPEISNLCKLHEEWIRGFFYELNRSVRVNARETKVQTETYFEFTLLLTY